MGGVLDETFDQRDVCLLLVSEAVTNAVLHAGTEVAVTCRTGHGWVRVEVRDWSPVVPMPRDYGSHAGTGRGIKLIDQLSSSWGVEQAGDQKVVWFELGAPPDCVQPEAPPDPRAGRRGEVRLEQPPLYLLPVMFEYGDAVLRELALQRLSGELRDELPDGWRIPPLELAPALRAIREAVSRNVAPTSIRFEMPLEAAGAAIDRLALVGLGDELAAQGRMLVPPPLPEIGLCRYWFLTEVASQLRGAQPQPWAKPELAEPLDPPHAIASSTITGMASRTEPTIIADDTNRIVYANDAALRLLGWNDELVGQRLTVIIPPDHRERHLAGFARVSLGGRPHLLGKPTVVLALHRSGSTVEVELTLSLVVRTSGRRIYRGELNPINNPLDEHHPL